MTGLLKWIFKHFTPYIAGMLIGVGFFFLLVYLLPMLPEVSLHDWSTVAAKKEVSLPLPAQSGAVVAPPAAAVAPASPTGAGVTGGTSEQSPKVTPTQPPLVASAPPVAPMPPVASAPPVAPMPPVTSAPPPSQQAPRFAEAGSVLSEHPNRGAASADIVVTEQPLDSELERDPVEMVVPRQSPAKPSAGKYQESARPDCGAPPMRPGRQMDQYLACQWRADCLNRLDRARRMIEQDKKRCPTVGGEAQSCLAYYHALEQQYHPSLCGGGWPNAQMPGW
ncbi:MAG: hypothetical protein H7835_11210 [Magnetococcus sp. XQGC-1]